VIPVADIARNIIKRNAFDDWGGLCSNRTLAKHVDELPDGVEDEINRQLPPGWTSERRVRVGGTHLELVRYSMGER